MANISEFYKKLRDLCEERNMTVNELVRILDLSSGSPTAWKSGSAPRQSTVIKLADYFGVTTDYLLGKEEQKKSALSEADLTEDELRILSAFREMSPERQKALADLLGIFDS